MKIKEMRTLSLDELQKKQATLSEELFRLRIRKSTGELERVSELRRVRRNIARVKTFLRQREVAR